MTWQPWKTNDCNDVSDGTLIISTKDQLKKSSRFWLHKHMPLIICILLFE